MIIFRAGAKDLAFHVNVDESLPDVLYGDEVRIRQVITNILNNAVKYTNEGSVTLTVRRERKPVDAAIQKESDRIRGQLDLIVAVADTASTSRRPIRSRARAWGLRSRKACWN